MKLFFREIALRDFAEGDIALRDFAEGDIALRDFAEGDIEVLFPNEVPRNFWLTPGITVVRLMPPMGRILDKHNGG
ncbi:Uncharacterised protein [Escherichia coli]|uniref:hypothetical protein n=1 Tax=Escherichia coli TaxID=562 RepID=UPI001A44DF1B|nr:hypothetical protein [Escherichia coli]VVY71793.1 Uncharacterised protein [Escherichia coli]VWM94636.1 Uncharacterised protein [Escherichia coli]